MPPVKKPAKPGKPNEPKKPSSRSKTKNAECSQAASNWQLSLRGKATLSPETYQTLAKCRALASSQRKADSYGRTGKLSEQGKTALESRLQSRFESGLITDKSRKAKLADLLAKRKAAQGAGKAIAKDDIEPVPAKYRNYRLAPPDYNPPTPKSVPPVKTGYDPETAVEKMGGKWWAKDSAGKNFPSPFKSRKEAVERAKMHQEVRAITQPAPAPPKYSLGGQLAPGRGTEARKQVADIVRSIRTADPKTAAGVLKSAGVVAIPSKFDDKKIAIKERDMWNAYSPRQAANRLLINRTLAGQRRKGILAKRAGLTV